MTKKNIKFDSEVFDKLNSSNFMDARSVIPSKESDLKKPNDDSQIKEIFPPKYLEILEIINDDQQNKSLFDSLEMVSLYMYEKYEGSIYYDDWMTKGKLPTMAIHKSLLQNPNILADKIISTNRKIQDYKDRINKKIQKKKRTKKDDDVLSNYDEKSDEYKKQLATYLDDLLNSVQDYELGLGGKNR